MMTYIHGLINPEARHAILVTGGVRPRPALLQALKQSYPTEPLFCADRGADLCMEAGVLPDALIGDLDSLSEETQIWLEANEVPALTFPPEKDYSDTELALEALYEKGVEEIIVLGALGGRMDHELANIMLLVRAGRAQKSLVFWDDANFLRYIGQGQHKLARTDGYVGIVPFSDDGMILSIEGLYYPLDHYAVPFGESRLISNVFAEAEEATISIDEGDGVLVISKDKHVEN